MTNVDTTTRQLRTLINTVRAPPPQDGSGRFMHRPVPSDLSRPDYRALRLFDRQADAFHDTLAVLEEDQRLEWVEHSDLDTAVWRVVCAAVADPGAGALVDDFIAEYCRDVVAETAFFAIEGLQVADDVELFGASFLPPGAVKMPERLAALASLVPVGPIDCVACVPVTGTSDLKMAGRARSSVEHALRLLRFTLREPLTFDDEHLRFKTGRVWWMEGGGHQWTAPAPPVTPVRLTDELITSIGSRPIAALGASAGTKLDTHLRIALEWFERSQLEESELPKMLYLFFALEAILGDQSAGLKGEKLALRRAVLGHLSTGSFRDPARAYVLYDQVRSRAVHGSKLDQPVTEKEVVLFSADVRDAIDECARLANERGFTRRGQLGSALDNDDVRTQLAAQLYERNPELWAHLAPEDNSPPSG